MGAFLSWRASRVGQESCHPKPGSGCSLDGCSISGSSGYHILDTTFTTYDLMHSTVPPFDRHDWIVRRQGGDEVRYVIDYYSAPPEPDGSPVFSLDVRPALDSVGSIKQRIAAATEETWAAFRENNARSSSQSAH